MIKIHRNIARLKNVDLFYLDTQTEGMVILCLHGRWGRAEVWYDFAQNYGDRYRIIAPDQKGHGLSGKPVSKYTPGEMADDMIALLDDLQIDSCIVAGHSMGGGIAGYLAALYPSRVEAAAILDKSASGPSTPNTLPPDQIPAIDSLTKDWPLPFTTRSEAMSFIRNAMDSDLAYQYFMNSLVETVDGYQMMFSPQAIAANIAYYQNWFHLLPNIQCPVLLVRSSSHEAVPDEDWDRMQTLMPHCMAYEMSHPDHNVMASNKEEFFKYFDHLLDSI